MRCPIKRTRKPGNPDNPQGIDCREVVHVNPDMRKIIQVLLSLLEEQEKAKITYSLEETA